MAGKVHTDILGAVGWLIFDNPDRHNALSLDMWRSIPDCMDRVEADPNVRVVALVGAGDKAFISGADISEFDTVRATTEGALNYEKATEQAFARIRDCIHPTVASIRGFCMGGGLGVALACDMRYARDDARFAIPAASLGVGYSFEGTKDLVSAVGPANARELLFTARTYTARDAEAMGLINRVYAKGALSPAVHDICAVMAEKAPLTQRAAKRAIRESIATSERARIEHVEMLIAECFASEDYVEGRSAFMEKRRPVFKGR